MWFGVAALVAMSTGELMGLPIACLGIWYALARRERVAGAVIAATGFAWTFLAIYVVVPHFSGEGDLYGFYDEVGGSPAGVVRKLLTDPGTVLGALVEGHDIAYVVLLGLPLLFLFVLSPALAAVAVPQLLANTLSDFRSMSDARYHSVAAVIPFLIAATVFGIARIGVPRRGLAAAAVLVCSATMRHLPRAVGARIGAFRSAGGRTSRQLVSAALAEAVALVPGDAAVTASNPAGAHLSARRYVYSVPVLGRAEWVVVDRADRWVVRPDSPILTRHPKSRPLGSLTRLEGDAGWTKVFDRASVVVFRKTAA